MSLCSLLLNLQISNGVQSVALESWNIQATSKGSYQTARMLVAHTIFLEISSRGSYMIRQAHFGFNYLLKCTLIRESSVPCIVKFRRCWTFNHAV